MGVRGLPLRGFQGGVHPSGKVQSACTFAKLAVTSTRIFYHFQVGLAGSDEGVEAVASEAENKLSSMLQPHGRGVIFRHFFGRKRSGMRKNQGSPITSTEV